MLGEKILRQLVRDIWLGSLSCHARHAIKRERTGAMPIRDDARGSVTAMHHRHENFDRWHPSCFGERRRRVVTAGKATLKQLLSDFVKPRYGALAPAPRAAIGCGAAAPPDPAPTTAMTRREPASTRDRLVFSGDPSGSLLHHALEEQARRIAHALHDEAGQLLAAIGMAVDDLGRELPTAVARLSTIKDLISLVGLQLRRVAYELRPTILDHLGLVPALYALVDRVRQDGGLHIVFDAALPVCPADVSVALYRMVQEGLTNVVRHARAENVRARIWIAADAVHCTIEDDGQGFDVHVMAADPAGGFGLLGMRERITALGGTLTIDSSPGAGTQLGAAIPVESLDARHPRPCR
jgi:signal transduction histidine kinase